MPCDPPKPVRNEIRHLDSHGARDSVDGQTGWISQSVPYDLFHAFVAGANARLIPYWNILRAACDAIGGGLPVIPGSENRGAHPHMRRSLRNGALEIRAHSH